MTRELQHTEFCQHSKDFTSGGIKCLPRGHCVGSDSRILGRVGQGSFVAIAGSGHSSGGQWALRALPVAGSQTGWFSW